MSHHQMIIILVAGFVVVLGSLYALTFKRACELFGLWIDYRDAAQQYRRRAIVFQAPDARRANLQAYQYAIEKARWKWIWLTVEVVLIVLGIIFVPISSFADLNAWIPSIVILSLGIIGLSLALPQWDPME